MDWHIVRVILMHELRMLLRQRRTVVLAVVLPLVTLPLMLLVAHVIDQRREESLEELVYRYAVTGSDAGLARRLIAQGKARLSASKPEEGEEDELAGFKSEEVTVADPEAALRDKEIQFYVEALAGADADALDAEALKGEEDKPREPGRSRDLRRAEPERLPGVPSIRIFYLADQHASAAGRDRMKTLLVRERRAERNTMLENAGFPGKPAEVMSIDETSVASEAQVTGSYLGRFLTFILLILTLGGGSVVAIDSIAGEKERGSLETLLTTAVTRGEVVAAKQILILAVALFITVVQIANILIYVGLRIIELPKDWVIAVPPGTVAAVLLLFVPLAGLVAAILLMLSAYAKSYKEAQLYFFPVNVLCWLPALASVLPGVSLRSAIVLVPIANVSIAVREIMVGKFDWPMIGVTFAVMVLAAVLTTRASARMLTQERLITAGEADAADFAGGPALFQRHVLRWFAIMGAALFVVALNMPPDTPMRTQVLFNELVIFLGGPALMIWKYRLEPREALALRPVKAPVWLAVLLAIPSGSLVATGIFRLADFVFPVPKRVLEQFARELLPKGIPSWEMVLLIAVLPAICEEIAFRGLLLYGLRRKLGPIGLTLVVGSIFGLFHVALFRIIPTAFLGVVLTAIALLTGSIFPCMALHAGNNALAFFLGRSGVELSKLDWWVYPAGVAGFALAFYLLYRNRTPYKIR